MNGLESSNENKCSINLNSNNNNNTFIDITSINNKSNAEVSAIETEIVNTNSTANNGSSAKFFKREAPKVSTLPFQSNAPLTFVHIYSCFQSDTKDSLKANEKASLRPDQEASAESAQAAQQIISSTAAKGFAALANKFNSNGSTALSSKPLASNMSSTNGKVNHDDLFKKFRQSVSTTLNPVNKMSTTTTTSTTNNNNNDKQPQQSTVNNSSTIQPKRNIFNTSIKVNSPGTLANASDTVKNSSLINSVKL